MWTVVLKEGGDEKVIFHPIRINLGIALHKLCYILHHYAKYSIIQTMKKIIWQGCSYSDLVAFPVDARRDAGYQLNKIQHGEDPNDWKPMSTIGPGVREIRIKEISGAFRIVFVANIDSNIYVLHAFQKKTQKTSLQDIRLAQDRFKEIKRLR